MFSVSENILLTYKLCITVMALVSTDIGRVLISCEVPFVIFTYNSTWIVQTIDRPAWLVYMLW